MPAFIPGLRRQEGTYFIKATEGLDSLRKDLDIGSKADIAQNLRFSTEVGSVTKRNAVAYYNNTSEPNSVDSVYRYYREANNTQTFIMLDGGLLRSDYNHGGLFNTIAGTVDTLPFNGSNGHRFTAVTYNDFAIISTGYDNIIQTDGQVAWELGSCKAHVVLDTTASQVEAGSHYYAVVFVVGSDIINGARSNFAVTDANHTSVSLSNIPLGPDACTARKIYRTTAGGATLKELYTISDNSTQTYTDITPDGSLGGDMAAVNNDMPRGLYLYVEQERLFVAHDVRALPRRKSIVCYSEQFLPHYIPTASSNLATEDPASNYEWISPDDNDFITGLINYLGTTFVFKQNTIRPWNVQGTPEVWIVGSVLSIIGSPAPYSIAATPLGILYQGYDHMYLFNGQYSVPIVDDFSFEENFLDSRRADNVAFFWNNLYLLAYTDANGGNPYHDRVLVYDLIRKQSSIDKGGPITKGTVTGAPGVMNVNCFTAFRGSGEWGQLYAGDGADGWVYQYDRTINATQLNTKSGIDLGTHNGSMAVGPEDNCVLTQLVLDNMETYVTDALAQAAWVTSVPDASKLVPPDLGNGVDGIKTVSADETLDANAYNYTSLTIDAGMTLTALGSTIKCLGTVTVNGSLICDTIYAQTVTISATGSVTKVTSIKCNTLNNAGTLITGDFCQADLGGYLADYADENLRDGSMVTKTTAYASVNTGGPPDPPPAVQGSCDFTIYFPSISLSSLFWAITENDNGGASSATGTVYLKIDDVWTSIEVHTAGTGIWSYSNTVATGWDIVTGIRINASVSSSIGYERLFGVELRAWASPVCSYIHSTGTVPTVGDITDFVPVLNDYSDNIIVAEGSYSLKVVCPETSDALNQYLVKTIPSVDLTIYDTILVDVWSLRTGTNIQFGMGNSAYSDNLKNVVVAAASTWVTYELDFTGATKDAITKIGVKFIDTSAGNIVFIDNIRPKQTAAIYTSPAFLINAQSLDKIYWNEDLNIYGTITIDTRSSNDSIAWDSWVNGLTTPAGSVITSSAKKYFQFRVNMSTSDGDFFPFIYKANGYNVKFTYWKVRSSAETAVEFRYRTGWRNFEQPFDDKIYRKIATLHEGAVGYFDARIECGEQDTQKFVFGTQPDTSWVDFSGPVSLVTYPNRWISMLPAKMYGKELRVEIYKNDANEFKLRQYGVAMETIPLI